jgi:hypothetical protein
MTFTHRATPSAEFWDTTGSFMLVMRTYLPGEGVVEQKWAPPPVARDR